MRRNSIRKEKKPHATSPGMRDLTPQEIREIRRETRRLNDPVRYVVYVRPFRGVNTRFFLDVSEDTFRLGAWTQATLFKQACMARLVAKAYSVQQQRRLYVARVTIIASGKKGGRTKR